MYISFLREVLLYLLSRDVHIYFLFRAKALRTKKVDVYFLSGVHALSCANALRMRKVEVYFLSRVHALSRANSLRTSKVDVYFLCHIHAFLPAFFVTFPVTRVDHKGQRIDQFERFELNRQHFLPFLITRTRIDAR